MFHQGKFPVTARLWSRTHLDFVSIHTIFLRSHIIEISAMMDKWLKQEHFLETLGRTGSALWSLVFKEAHIQLAESCPCEGDLLVYMKKQNKPPPPNKNNPPKPSTNMTCFLKPDLSQFLAPALALWPTDFNISQLHQPHSWHDSLKR